MLFCNLRKEVVKYNSEQKLGIKLNDLFKCSWHSKSETNLIAYSQVCDENQRDFDSKVDRCLEIEYTKF